MGRLVGACACPRVDKIGVHRLKKCPPFFRAVGRDVPRYARPHRVLVWKNLMGEAVSHFVMNELAYVFSLGKDRFTG